MAERFLAELSRSLGWPRFARRRDAMKSIRSLFFIAAVFALVFFPASLAHAQSSEAQELNKKVVELYQAGRYDEAIPLAQQVLAIDEKAFGPDRPEVATDLNNLAALNLAEGRSADAESLYKRSLEIREKALGPDHPYVAQSLNNLAELYDREDRDAEAELLYKRALPIQEKALVPDSLNNLAWLYYRQGRYAEAEPLYKRSLAIYEKVLGPDHPYIAQVLKNFAAFYQNWGRYAEAEPLVKRELAIWENAFGPDYFEVAEALRSLALLEDTLGRYAEAELLYKRALAIREEVIGPDHPDVESLSGLASLYVTQGRYAEAEPLYKRSLAIREKALGPDHRDVAEALRSLAWLYYRQGRYAEAEPLYKRSLAIYEKILGSDSLDFAATLDNLASLYVQQIRYAEAEPLYKRALVIQEKALVPDHPSVATSLNGLAGIYEARGRYADAELLVKRVLAIWEKAFGPDHPDVASALNRLAHLDKDQGRYTDAEPLYKRSLEIREKALGPDHPDVAQTLNFMAGLYWDQGRDAEAELLFRRSLAIRDKALGPHSPQVATALNYLIYFYDQHARYADALPLVRRAIADKEAATWTALPILFGAQNAKLIATDDAIDDGLSVFQDVWRTSAGEALNALAVRFSVGSDRLAELVRRDQDLAGEAANLDKAIMAAVTKELSKHDPIGEQQIRDRIAAIGKERADLEAMLMREYPDYAALSNPQPLTAKDIHGLLADDEALIIVDLGDKKSYVWAITRTKADWKELSVTSAEVSKQVSVLRDLLNVNSRKPFDTKASYELYREILAPVEELLVDKPRLSLVLYRALTSLPPQLLVTRDPTGKALKDVDWLIRSHSVTVLPSVASLKVLRRRAAIEAPNPLIGFADPVFDRSPLQLAENTRAMANIAAMRGIRGSVADIAELRTALPPLPETATELKKVAASVHANPAALFLGADATETRVKRERLDQFRIVYFATHGLLAGDVADFAKLNAEPALVLTLPEHPTEFDDGLLTASEVAQLKLNADWVVLSACNTASAGKPGADALSGLARAFFYAGARSLVVSNWEVDSDSAVALMTGTFASLAADPKLSHAEALQKSMLAMINNAQRPDWADPKYWAPFVVVGEPAKPAN
jgi:tetratricopeptide (TPR) repeat protein/CHAT domain-containing protein